MIVEVRQLFELLLDPIRDLLHRLQGGGPGPQRLHHHGLDGEGRVLVAAEPAIFKNTGERDDQHEVDDEALMLQRPAGEVEGLHLLLLPAKFASASRTFWPTVRVFTPAVTTMSPLARPLAMTTVFAS